jgi:hypothetical protein
MAKVQTQNKVVSNESESESKVVQSAPQFELPKLMAEHKTKSNVIRFLSGQGWTRSQIASFMNIRYQHVRNVLIQPLKQKVEEVKPTEVAAQ